MERILKLGLPKGSLQVLGRKGDTSGHCQVVKSIRTDCERDTLLIQVEQIGAACHNGTRTCFTDPAPGIKEGL